VLVQKHLSSEQELNADSTEEHWLEHWDGYGLEEDWRFSKTLAKDVLGEANAPSTKVDAMRREARMLEMDGGGGLWGDAE